MRRWWPVVPATGAAEPSVRDRGRALILPLLLTVLLAVAVRAPLLDIPFERDEGEYAYIAWRMPFGELPYRDWFDQKPPGIFLVYRAALAFPGDPVRNVHAAGLLFSAATAAALLLCARAFLPLPWACASSCLFVLLSADPVVQGTAANTELFMLLPQVLAILVFLRWRQGGEHRPALLLLLGVLTGIASLFKQVALLNGAFLLAAVALGVPSRDRARAVAGAAGWAGAGFFAIWSTVAAYFAARGGLGALVEQVITHNLTYASAVPLAARFDLFVGTAAAIARSQALVWMAAAAGIVVLAREAGTRDLALLGGWLAAGVLGASVSGYFFPHYFQQVLPALAVLAALGARRVADLRLWSTVPRWTRGAGLCALLAVLPAASLAPFVFRLTPAEASRAIYPGNFFAEMPAVAGRIAALTKPDDRVFVFGAEPEVLFHAGRVSATRYIFLFPLYGPYRDARARQEAAAAEVQRAGPAAALYLPNRLFSVPGSEQFFTLWTQEYLAAGFSADTYLTRDENRVSHLVPGEARGGAGLPPGHRLVGAVLVRQRGAGGREGPGQGERSAR